MGTARSGHLASLVSKYTLQTQCTHPIYPSRYTFLAHKYTSNYNAIAWYTPQNVKHWHTNTSLASSFPVFILHIIHPVHLYITTDETPFSCEPNTHPSTLYCTNISIHNRQQLTHPSNYKALTPNKPLNTLHCTEHTQTSFHGSGFQQYYLANAIECPQMQPMLY